MMKEEKKFREKKAQMKNTENATVPEADIG